MKILTILIISIICFSKVSAQQQEEEQKIMRLLSKNSETSKLKVDSTYMFAIEIVPLKKGYSIRSKDKISMDILGNLDSLFSHINFDLFQDKKRKRRLILPVGIIVVNSGNENKGMIKNVGKLPKAIDVMFDVSNTNRFKSIYIRPFFAILDKVVMH